MMEEGLVSELVAAHQRGVQVRVVLDPVSIDQFVPLIHHGPRGLFNAFAVRRLKEAGVDVRFVKLPEDFITYHMKLAIFDDKVLFVGSANWDDLAMTRAGETVMEIAGGPVVDHVVSWFQHVWEYQSTEPEFGLVARAFNFLYRKLY